MNINLLKRTIQGILEKEGITKWRAIKRPLLLTEYAAKRLTFATEYNDFNESDWERVIFSDECSIQRGAGLTQTWVYRTLYKKYNKDI